MVQFHLVPSTRVRNGTFSAGRRTASIRPPGVSPVLWCNHGALIMTAASVKKECSRDF